MNMRSKGIDIKRLLPSQNREAYISAVKEFTQKTIKEPSFFKKTPEEQKEIALSFIRKHQYEGLNHQGEEEQNRNIP